MVELGGNGQRSRRTTIKDDNFGRISIPITPLLHRSTALPATARGSRERRKEEDDCRAKKSKTPDQIKIDP